MQSAYSLTREVIAAIREGLPEADQMQPGQVFQHHMFGRLKRHSFCFLLLICAQGPAGMFDPRFAVRSLTSRTSTRRRGPRLRKTKNDFAAKA